MSSWVAAFITCATLAVPTVILVRKRAPKWVIWTTWVIWGAIWLIAAGLSIYGFHLVPIAVMLVFGVIVGLAGGLVAYPPFARKPHLPGRFEGGARRRWRRLLH